jgi:hypothetical protein
MECEQCGARRPLLGPCPNCGAPPAGRSSGADWRNRSGKGPAAPSRGRGNSNAGWGGSGQNWGGRGNSGAGWGYEEPGGGRSTGRYRRPPDDYQEVDLERALVPSMDLSPAEMGQIGGGLPAVPGMPSEDVERLLGIRRPVYIPATGKKRRMRIGGVRVVGGVLSILLVCVASCGLASVFGKKYVDGLSQVTHLTATPPSFHYELVPATPVATPGKPSTAGVKFIASVTTSKRIDSSYQAVDVTSHFLVGDTVYVVVQVRGMPQGKHTLCANWYLNGEYLPLPSSSQTCATLSNVQNGGQDSGPDHSVAFNLPYPQAGVGMARIYWDRPANDTDTSADDPTLVSTIVFGIFMPATPTAVPSTPSPSKTPPKTTPGVTPTKSASAGAPGAV